MTRGARAALNVRLRRELVLTMIQRDPVGSGVSLDLTPTVAQHRRYLLATSHPAVASWYSRVTSV